MIICSWLNCGHCTPPGRRSAAGWKFLAPPYYSQLAVFASSLWALFSLSCYVCFVIAGALVAETTSCCQQLLYQMVRNGMCSVAGMWPKYLHSVWVHCPQNGYPIWHWSRYSVQVWKIAPVSKICAYNFYSGCT